jgi:hypothetical protein
LFQKEQKNDIVGEYDDLATFGFLHKPARHAFSPPEIKGRDRIIENYP